MIVSLKSNPKTSVDVAYLIKLITYSHKDFFTKHVTGNKLEQEHKLAILVHKDLSKGSLYLVEVYGDSYKYIHRTRPHLIIRALYNTCIVPSIFNKELKELYQVKISEIVFIKAPSNNLMLSSCHELVKLLQENSNLDLQKIEDLVYSE